MAQPNNNKQSKNHINTQGYQPNPVQDQICSSYYLQQQEITKLQLTNFTQIPNRAEALQTIMNPYFLGGSSIKSDKPLMVFTATDPEYSVEDYLMQLQLI